MASEERAAFLHRIIAIARNIKKEAIVKGGLSEENLLVTSNAKFEIPTHFFSPHHIKNDLVGLGLSSDAVNLLWPVISTLTDVYHRAFDRLSATRRLPGMPSVHEIMENLASYYRQIYEKEVLPTLRERIFALLSARDDSRFVEVDETESSFNTVSLSFYVL